MGQSKIINKIINESVELKNLEESGHFDKEEAAGQAKPFIMSQLLPDYELDDLLEEENMVTIICEGNHRIAQDN